MEFKTAVSLQIKSPFFEKWTRIGVIAQMYIPIVLTFDRVPGLTVISSMI
jgi:hypothetical protein